LLLQETKDISNIHMDNITQSLHLKLSTSVLCVSCHFGSSQMEHNDLEKKNTDIFNVKINVTTQT